MNMASLLYEVLYYIYVLVFGVYVSLKLACGKLGAREWKAFALTSPVLLLLQGLCLQAWDISQVRLLYPLITHLPMLLVCILALKVRWNIALISVVVSYSMCQLPRWVGLVIYSTLLPPAAALLIHLAISQLILILLGKYCLGAIHDVLCGIERPLLRFGALPLIYYLYEYFMVYTQQRFAQLVNILEFMPTGLVLCFILFAVAYRREMEKRAHAERQNSALEMQLNHAEQEITMLRVIQEQTAVYRHDLHHHLLILNSMLSSGLYEQAAAYIHRAEDEITTIAPERFCENETVNLLLGAFKGKAGERGVRLSVKAALPHELKLPDTELCAMLSNGLENALNAACAVPDGGIDVYCGVRQSKLLIEIKNPYTGEIHMKDGLPQAADPLHGYGCRSIQSIVQRRKGVCSFEPARGSFILRIAIPLE